MEIGYYPGCSQTGTAKEYDKSLREILKILDVEPKELQDWSCCGATSAHVTSHKLATALSARNLAIAEKHGLKELFAPCAACFSRLAVTRESVYKTHPPVLPCQRLSHDPTVVHCSCPAGLCRLRRAHHRFAGGRRRAVVVRP